MMDVIRHFVLLVVKSGHWGRVGLSRAPLRDRKMDLDFLHRSHSGDVCRKRKLIKLKL